MLFNARLFKSCWTGARRGASTDEGRPILTCLNVDVFDEGLRIVSTDSYTMVVTWLPNVDHDLADWPTNKDEAPLTLLLHDRSNSVIGPCAGAGPDSVVDVTIDQGGMEVASTFQLGRQAVTLEHLTFGDFPAWRGFFFENVAKRDANFDRTLGFDPARLSHVASIVGGTGRNPIQLRFIDHLKPVQVRRHGSHHRALLMPCRISSDQEVTS